jgi:phage tail-like protein
VAEADFYTESVHTGLFLFEVDGEEIGSFLEVSGLQVEVEIDSIEEGGNNAFVHKMPGRMTWPNLVFKRGLTKSDNLFTWLQQSAGDGLAANGNKLERKNAAITLLDQKGTRLRTWEVDGAFAVRWQGPTFAAGGDEFASEELEIAHHGFRARNL